MKTTKSTNVGMALAIARELYPDIPKHEFRDWMEGRRIDAKMDLVRGRIMQMAEKMWWMTSAQLQDTKRVVEVLKEMFPGRPKVWVVGVEKWVERLFDINFH